jgi:hypothetical protein
VSDSTPPATVYQTFDAVPAAVPTQSLRARSKYDIEPGAPGATLPAPAWALAVFAVLEVAAPALDAASGSIAPAVPNAARIPTKRL